MVVAQANYISLQGLPTVAVFVLAAMALAAWVATYLLLRRLPGPAWTGRLLPAVRVVTGIVATMLVFAAVARVLMLSTGWPIWLLAVMASTCVESLIALYALERRVAPGRGGRIAAALRIALAMVLIAMLAQPVWSWDRQRQKPKTVAVLLDNSASMHVSQKYLTPGDKVRLGEAMAILARPYKLDALRGELSVVQRRLIETRDWLNTLQTVAQTSRGKQILTRRADLGKGLDASGEALADALDDIWGDDDEAGRMLADQKVAMADLESMVSGDIANALAGARDVLKQSGADDLGARYEDLLGRTNAALAGVTAALRAAAPLADKLDTAYYAAMDEDTRKKLDATADRTRYQLAREVLQRQRGGKDSFLEQIADDCVLDLYTFDSTIREIALGAAPLEGETTPDQQRTALAAAMEKVLAGADQSTLVGVVILSDMRHNGPGLVRDVAREFGWKSIPVCPVVFGSAQPPPDAAVASVSAPETLFPEDKLYVSAKLKLDGMAGKDVVVTLNDVTADGKDEEVDRHVVHVPDGLSFRPEVPLSCMPDKLGDHTYRVRIEPIAGEALTENNEIPLSVRVHDDRTKMLLVDTRPRWEMRYLKNLFTNRDASVNLQYVILRPDRTENQPGAKILHASATRPRGNTEANALPEKKEDWLKFDVIILGDVSPDALGTDGFEALGEFVRDRAGTLICISGQEHMPHAFGQTVLEEILPVDFRRGPEAPKMVEKAFRIDLTTEGRHSVITRMDVDPDENLRIWEDLPDIYWRHPIKGAKAGTTVLAYARGADVPGPIRETMSGTERNDRLAEILDYQRTRALVVTHSVGRGRVMFLGSDRTWRLRYRQGDTYHHRFWGQVLRWAMADRLSSGTALVKLGTDRQRYTVDDRVRVRAQIFNTDNTPMKDGEVTVEVYREKTAAKGALGKQRQWELVGGGVMTPVKDAPGAYSGDVGKMKVGAHRVVLAGQAVKQILAVEGAAEGVEAGFTVGASASDEQVELAADPVLAAQVARASGGLSVEPAQIDRVLKALGVGQSVEPPKRAQWDLWDSWPLLLVLLAMVTAEWLIRKRIGLT